MAEESTSANRNWLWWLAGGITACIVLAAVVGAWFIFAERKVWTDDRDILRGDDQAKLRYVLWAKPEALGEQVNSPQQEYEPSTSPDGGELYFVRGLPGKGADIYVARRGDDGKWGKPKPLATINTADHDELGPRLTPDGRFLLFYSDRPGGSGQYDIWSARRIGDKWGAPLNLGPAVNSKYNDYGPTMGPKGKRLYFSTNRKAAARRKTKEFWRATIRQSIIGDYDLFVSDLAEPQPAEATTEPATKPAGGGSLRFAAARELKGVNTPHHEGASTISPGGDFLYFSSNRPGGSGGFDLYRCRLHAGRAGEVENLGIEINTPANETDPQLGMSGFLIYFSSDRPGSLGGYDLFVAESREVYASSYRRPLPQLGWSWWALLAAVAVLVPLLLFLRAAGYEHLSLLQKCIVASLLFHILLTMLLSAWKISQEMIEYVAREAGMVVAVNLDISREVETKQRIRRRNVQLPQVMAKTADLPRMIARKLPRVAPRRMRTNVPLMTIHTSPVVSKALRPKLIEPTPTDKVSLPPPKLLAIAPQIEIARDQRVTEAEDSPAPDRPRPPPMQMRTSRTVSPPQAPREVEPVDAPARPRVESMARAPDAPRPEAPKVEPDRPRAHRPSQILAAAPQVRMTIQDKVATDEGAPQPSRTILPAERKLAAGVRPNPAALAFAFAAPPVQPDLRSLARPADANRVIDQPRDQVLPEARAPERPLADAPVVMMTTSTKVGDSEGAPTAEAAPSQDVKMLSPETAARQLTARPVAPEAEPGRMEAKSLVTAKLPDDLARPQTSRVQPEAKVLPAMLTIADPRDAARLGAVSPTDPTATPLTAAAIKVAVASPRTAATGSQLAVPTATAIDRSLAVAITVTPQAPVKTLLVTIDLRGAEDGPSVRLPEVTVLTRTSERGPTSTLDRPDPLEPMPISAVREDRRDDATVNGDAPPAEHADESLVSQLVADVRGPRRSDVMSRRALPKAMLQPLAGTLGPGRLAAPRSLFQRSFEQRKRLINEMGGTKETEASVAKALAYLASNQEPDGRWKSFITNRTQPTTPQVDAGVTGLAALCFLASDHTPAKPGPYRQTIKKALDRLVKMQKPDGDLRAGAQMYSHAIATLALGEAAAMTGNAKYMRAAGRGVQFIVRCQHPAGGWRYNPRQAGDTSVVGWQVMAMHSVERIGWKMPDKTRKTALAWLRSVSRGKHRMLSGYVAKDGSPAMAAEGAFARLLLGKRFNKDEEDEISNFLLANPPAKSPSDYYYWYYASLALMQLQGEAWGKWNTKIQKVLLKLQKPDGSWDPKGRRHNKGGRIYTTAMSTLTLEVYYRYLPMYGRKTEDRNKE